MKRKILILAILLITILFSSCSIGDSEMFSRFGKFYNKNDHEVVNSKFEEVLTAIQNKDKKVLKSLFAKNALLKVENFDNSAEELFDYYDGNYTSYDDWGGPMESEEIKHGERITELCPTYDIITDKGNYRATMKIISVDTNDSDNIGVWSIYIIKAENDDDLSCAYWGDIKYNDSQYTTGININKKSIPDTN